MTYDQTLAAYFDLELIFTQYDLLNPKSRTDTFGVIKKPYLDQVTQAQITNYNASYSEFSTFPYLGPREAIKFHIPAQKMLSLMKQLHPLRNPDLLLNCQTPIYPAPLDLAALQSARVQLSHREYKVLNQARQEWYG